MEVTEAADALIAQALRGVAPWPAAWAGFAQAQSPVIERALYHGVAGLLDARPEALAGWPDAVRAALRRQALGQAMWEARHRALLGKLLAALAEKGVRPLLLKGTALAYSAYVTPALRSRGDTDMLVAEHEVDAARACLAAAGLTPAPEGPLNPAEAWFLDPGDGSEHSVDLHAELVNQWAVRAALGHTQAWAGARALPALSPHAFAPGPVFMLMHACLHRGQHITSPYQVGGRSYKGGNRLIWLMDIHLLATSLSPPEWDELCAGAARDGIARLCRDGLEAAAERLGTMIPDAARERLTAAGSGRLDRYFLDAGSVRRAIMDLSALPGLTRKADVLFRALVPPEGFMRQKYPEMASRPLAMLHARRIAGFLRRALRA
jgi:hypothetical protein